jgi:ADP-ribose pyrophosphatase YjhB (NUDIX family)
MNLQVGVKIVLQNEEGKILLLERNPAKYPEIMKSDSFDIVGGRINVGTPLLENLKREIFEETKLELLEEPKLLAAQDILREDKHVVRLTYIGKTKGDPRIEEDAEKDHISYKWLTKEEIKNTPGIDQYFMEVFEKYIS